MQQKINKALTKYAKGKSHNPPKMLICDHATSEQLRRHQINLDGVFVVSCSSKRSFLRIE